MPQCYLLFHKSLIDSQFDRIDACGLSERRIKHKYKMSIFELLVFSNSIPKLISLN